jgi:Fe-S cluster assembly iron-binding protein IscA
MMIAVTESAIACSRELLDNQDGEVFGKRVFVNSPGRQKLKPALLTVVKETCMRR